MAAPGDAAQEKVARCLKDLPLRLQTHKLTTRREIFKDLTDLLETQELGEKVVGGICRVLSVTLMRYCDSESRRLVLDFIRLASGKQPQAVAKAVHGALVEGGAGGWRKARPTLALAKHCLAGLAWSCAVLENEAAWGEDGVKFVDIHSILLPIIMGASAPQTGGQGNEAP